MPYHYIKLSKWVKDDLTTWLHFLNRYNGITFFRYSRDIPAHEINMVSDASKLGFGAAYGRHWVQCRWPKQWTDLHITVLELYPIFVIVSMFCNKLRNSNILLHCDNSAVVTIINKQSSRNKHVMAIIRPLVLTLMNNNIKLRAIHIPGVANVLADKLSRFQESAETLPQYGMQSTPDSIPYHLRPENFIMA